ncbi:NrfD/PsrC family molybdoenzyme membrane anchor subunit [Nitrospirillum amazonense]|uniref:Quinol:cytochrome c oxidoreductase quinone-binding subunit 1 n=1 Tax=Nitrospirillum amazonense TaxID=28077 RepID=A0A560JF12_9PROT|nr:NrfD/PsrC family molybdoenzyme membrane anchor subunit [Nitrospirillum amazonense]MDG3439414.1 polysulfide reductase NrfD [Nitrospirillum amazonense]TWB69798.1 quinol:cytochrome c oxidoreductase quinone-binding subunit 1 [Nitrospirillum amazonense]
MTDATDTQRADTQRAAAYAHVTAEVTGIPLHYPRPRAWWLCFLPACGLLAVFFTALGVLLWNGVGVWGLNIPVNWGFDIVNYIWFLGIGHAGTLISAMLLLLNVHWRNSLNRFAEAMTLFAVVCAGLYPLMHLGRPWLFYWVAPYPNSMTLWPQFKSPLTWDFFAVLTYLTVSALFWYIGIVPDLAATRDRARGRLAQVLYGLGALGWRGSAHHWARWGQAYRLTAAIAVPLVVSVHSEISLLLAAGPVPGWSSTVFPPYFVLGAAFSGFAVVSMIAVVLRGALGLQDLVRPLHLDMLGRLLLATGLMTAYGYAAEVFDTLYGGEKPELSLLADRLTGPFAWSYWGAVIANFAPLQLLWWRGVRRHPLALFLIGFSAMVGMWCERFMLLATSLHHSWVPSSWRPYTPSFWEVALFAGMLGVFLVPFLVFVRFLPVISAFEVKEALFEESEEKGGGHAGA